jgi:hypothetical protein
MHGKFWSESLKRRDYFRELNVCKRTILNWILKETAFEVMDKIHLAQDRKSSRLL